MSEEFVCAYCGMDLESPGEFHDIGSCAKYLRETRVKMRNEINTLQSRIAELEELAQQLVWVGNDLLADNTNPVTITLFSGLAFRSKELLP